MIVVGGGWGKSWWRKNGGFMAYHGIFDSTCFEDIQYIYILSWTLRLAIIIGRSIIGRCGRCVVCMYFVTGFSQQHILWICSQALVIQPGRRFYVPSMRCPQKDVRIFQAVFVRVRFAMTTTRWMWLKYVEMASFGLISSAEIVWRLWLMPPNDIRD